MPDPKTLAFNIPNIFKKPIELLPGHFYQQPLITVWHCDPEAKGDDDSCGWFCPHVTDNEKKYAEELIDNPNDNLRHWFDNVDEDEAKFRIMRIFRLHKKLLRPWWKSPKYHFWHWQLQIHPYEQILKFLKKS